MAATAGTFKTAPNYVRDTDAPSSLFGYTAPCSVQAALSDWSAFTLASESGKNELVRQILSHWMFEQIHPVADGNGRIGRLLVPIVLRAKGITNKACALFGEAVHAEKSLYIEALKDARVAGNPTNYVRQMLSFLRQTADTNIARIQNLEAIELRWKARFMGVRSDSIVQRIYPYALRKPVFTVGEVQAEFHVRFDVAQTAARMLLDKGMLTIPECPNRNQLFHAHEVLGVFDSFKTPVPSRTVAM